MQMAPGADYGQRKTDAAAAAHGSRGHQGRFIGVGEAMWAAEPSSTQLHENYVGLSCTISARLHGVNGLKTR